MKKKVLVIILLLLMILGIAIIISRYREEKELIIAKNDEIILNGEAEEKRNEIENNNLITENERTEEIEEVTNDSVVSNKIEDKVSVDIDKQQSIDNKNVEVIKIEDSKETMTTTKKENTQKQINEVQDTTDKETKVIDENEPIATQPITTTQDNLKCVNDHYMEVGNAGEWFNTKDEAIAIYNNEISYWADKWNSNEITAEEYYSNCPYGYEVWRCLCGKWTINYYYR